jgi:hypothetical protein
MLCSSDAAKVLTDVDGLPDMLRRSVWAVSSSQLWLVHANHEHLQSCEIIAQARVVGKDETRCELCSAISCLLLRLRGR